MSIRAVVFDFGGVLVRTVEAGGRRKWEQRLGLSTGELDRLVFASELSDHSMVGQATQCEVWQHIGTRLGLDDETLQQLRRDFWAGDRLDEQLVLFLRGLRPRYKTAILSNIWSGARQMFSEHFGLGDTVDEFIISSEEGVAKPDPRIYHITLQRLRVQPHEAILVDDFIENVEGAQAVGMTGILFRDTAQAVAEVQCFLDDKLPARAGMTNMDRIAQIFDAYFGQWNIHLPEAALTARLGGRIAAAGWTINYLFGADERGDYLDFYATHRMTNDRHVRIRVTGETELLPALLDDIVYPPDASPDQQRQVEQEYRRHNIGVVEDLRRKGWQ